MTFRNYLNHKFNLKTNFNLKEYEKYVIKLKDLGATEIEHAGRRLTKIQKQRKNDVIKILHDQGLKAILYTGPFGKDTFEKYAQRDINNKPLQLMCPSSNYIDDILLPELNDVLENYDGIFFDMPWIDKHGCYCNSCDGDSEKNVRTALKKIVKSVNIKASANVCAPTIHNEYPSAHIDNIKGIFDEYVTEWNPLRWNQNIAVVKNAIEYAKKATDKKIYHATTCSDKKGNIYSIETLSKLFYNIKSSGATPRLGIGFNESGLNNIKEALYRV